MIGASWSLTASAELSALSCTRGVSLWPFSEVQLGTRKSADSPLADSTREAASIALPNGQTARCSETTCFPNTPAGDFQSRNSAAIPCMAFKSFLNTRNLMPGANGAMQQKHRVALNYTARKTASAASSPLITAASNQPACSRAISELAKYSRPSDCQFRASRVCSSPTGAATHVPKENGSSTQLCQSCAITCAFGKSRAICCGNGPHLEYGGAWITPWQHRIRSLVEEHGLSLRPRHSVTARYCSLRDGGLFASGPTSDQQRAAHERVLARVASNSMLVKLGRTEDEIGRPLTPFSFSKYLDRLNPPDATRHLFSCTSFGQWRSRMPSGMPGRRAGRELRAQLARYRSSQAGKPHWRQRGLHPQPRPYDPMHLLLSGTQDG